MARHRVNVNMDDETFRRITRRTFYGPKLKMISVAVAVIAFLAWLGRERTLFGIAAFAATLVAYTLSLKFIYARYEQNAMLAWREMTDHRIQYTFDDKGVEISNVHGTSRVPWGAFSRLIRKDGIWLLYFGRPSPLAVPGKNLKDDVREFILDRLRDIGAKLK